MLNSSGLLSLDAAAVLILTYVFNGGVLVTLAGVVMSILLMRRAGDARRGAWLLIACFAPLLWMGLWWSFAQARVYLGDSSDGAILAIIGVHVLLIGAAPLAALLRISRRPAP